MSVKDIIILGCSSQQPTRYRNHGAYLFRWNEEGLLFDPGEGTQRQFILANVSPTCVTRILISHFHGDHCLGLGSMLMRLNLDKISHPVKCYYPASGKKNFDYLHYGCLYHETIKVVEYPISSKGVVEEDGKFIIEANYLEHGVETIGYRVSERDKIKFNKEALKKHGISGLDVKKIETEKKIEKNGKIINLEDVSYVKKGDSIAVILDTKLCQNAIDLARGAKVLLCESTYLENNRDLANKYNHMTARDAATLAKEAGVELLILTHFSARYSNHLDFENEAKEIFPNSIAAEDFKKIEFPKD